MRALGARVIRVFVQWSLVAPKPDATSKPRFDASNPSAYPASNWAPYDALVRTAQEQGIVVDLEITGGGPHWAEGRALPTGLPRGRQLRLAPEPGDVRPVRARGDRALRRALHAPGATGPLPAVHFWSFWNEPNFGQDLGPQAIDGSTKPIAPALYRSLLDAGYAALRQTQPDAHNTVLIGELAATGYALHAPGDPGKLPGVTAQTRALVFLRALYCVDDRYRPLQGSTATRYGCPATAAGARSFRLRNPALFDATGFADHPYSSRRAPNANPAKINRDYATFPVLDRVAKALDGVTGAYGSHKRLPIYNDEYGYITSPPQPAGLRYPTPQRAATELNQAEYLSYKNPRVASYAQFLLDDPPITAQHPKPGFSSGLYTADRRGEGDAVGLPTAALAAADDGQGGLPRRDLGRRPAGHVLAVGDPADRADGRDPDAEGRQRTLDHDPDRRGLERHRVLRHPHRRCPTAAACGWPTATRRPSRSCRPTSPARRSTAGPSP